MPQGKRTNRVKIQLTDSEKAVLEASAREAGCSVPELVRAVLVHRTMGVPKASGQGVKATPRKRQARNADFHVSLSEPEKEALKARAEAAGCTPSELVRRAAVYGETRVVCLDAGPLKDAYVELGRQGVNLNQLMRFLNTYGIRGYDRQWVEHAMGKVYSVAEKVEAALESLKIESLKR